MTEIRPEVNSFAGELKPQSRGRSAQRISAEAGEGNPAPFKGIKYKVTVDNFRIPDDKLPGGTIRTLIALRPHQLEEVARDLSRKWGLGSAAGIKIERDYSR